MSSQPSTSEKIKQTTNSALDSVSSTASAADPNYDPNKDRHNFAKDDLGNKFKKGDYKDQLNQAAHGGPKTEEEKPQGYLEKVASYIPGISSLQQHAYEQGPEEDTSSKTPPGPPNRPDHDVQVEEFLRKQYSSSSGTGIPEPKGSS